MSRAVHNNDNEGDQDPDSIQQAITKKLPHVYDHDEMKKKKKHRREISVDDISIKLEVSNKVKKKKHKKRNPSTPPPTSSSSDLSYKARRKKTNKASKSRSKHKQKSSAPHNDAKNSNNHKHNRQRSNSDVLMIKKFENTQKAHKSKKNINIKKIKMTQDDSFVSDAKRKSKKNRKHKKQRALTPKASNRSNSKSNNFQFAKQKNYKITTTSPKHYVKTPSISSNSSDSLKYPEPSPISIPLHTTKDPKISNPETSKNNDTKNDIKKVKKKMTPTAIHIPSDDEKTTSTLPQNAWPEAPIDTIDVLQVESTKFRAPSLTNTEPDDPQLSDADKPIKIEEKNNKKQQTKSAKKPSKNKEKFKKAKIRSKSGKTPTTKKKKKRPETPTLNNTKRQNAINKKYGGLSTPTTPKHFRWNANKSENDAFAQQKMDYLKMQKMYREIKKDLRKLKSDNKALEIEKRRIKKDQNKLRRDQERFEIDMRTFNLKRDGNDLGKKYGIDEEDKLRKMLYDERKQWSEERKNLRAEILRLQGEVANIKHTDNKRIVS